MPNRPDPAAVRRAKGETRPSRQVEVLYPDHASRPDPDVIEPPRWLSRMAKQIFRDKVERYRQRGQKIEGFEEPLAQYCALEAELIDARKKKLVPPIAMITAHRQWANEFYDTPSSQKIAQGSGNKRENRFARNGRRGA